MFFVLTTVFTVSNFSVYNVGYVNEDGSKCSASTSFDTQAEADKYCAAYTQATGVEHFVVYASVTDFLKSLF